MFVIYSREDCSFCRRAKEILDQLGLAYEERSIADYPVLSDMLRNQGFRTVPQIYVDDKHIGGYTDLEGYLLDNFV